MRSPRRPRPEPRINAFVHVEMRPHLKAFGSATIYGSREFAAKVSPGERAIPVTIILHTPRVRRRTPRLTGAAADWRRGCRGRT